MDENMTHTTAQPIFMISSERAQRLSVCNSSHIKLSKTRETREKGKRRKQKKEEEEMVVVVVVFGSLRSCAGVGTPRQPGFVCCPKQQRKQTRKTDPRH